MRKARISVVLILFINSICLAAAHAAVKQNAVCTKVSQVVVVGGYKFTCIKINGKLVWSGGKKVKTMSTNTTPPPTTTPAIPQDPISIQIETLMKPAGGVSGVLLKSVKGATIANFNSDTKFEPASSIKVLIAYYAFTKISSGQLHLDDKIQAILADSPSICPNPTPNGHESVEVAIREMMQRSDNNRATELMEYLGVPTLNSFAKSIGLMNTSFNTTPEFPGFIPLGCALPYSTTNPETVHGNVSTLKDLTKIWELVSNLSEPYRNDFMRLTAGQEMAASQGYDFTGIWSDIVQIVKEEAPTSLSQAEVNSFIAELKSNSKGGSDVLCISTSGCTKGRWWLSMFSLTTIPTCLSTKIIQSDSYVWGYFIVKADTSSIIFDQNNSVSTAFLKVGAEPIRNLIHNSLSTWGNC